MKFMTAPQIKSIYTFLNSSVSEMFSLSRDKKGEFSGKKKKKILGYHKCIFNIIFQKATKLKVPPII